VLALSALRLDMSAISLIWWAAITISAAISLVILLRRGARPELGLLFLMTFAILAMVRSNSDYAVVKSLILLFLILSGLFLAVSIIRDLRTALIPVKQEQILSVFFRTLFLWLPVLMVCWMMVSAIQMRDRLIANQLYNISVDDAYACTGDRLICQSERRDMENQLDLTMGNLSIVFERAYEKQRTDFTNEGRASDEEVFIWVEDALFDGDDAVFPPDLSGILPTHNCQSALHWLTRPGECVKARMSTILETQYLSHTEKIRSDIQALKTENQSEGAKNAVQLIDQLDQQFVQGITEFRQSGQAINRGYFFGRFLLSVLFFVTLATLLVKSFLFIFARVLYSTGVKPPLCSWTHPHDVRPLIKAQNISLEAPLSGFRQSIGNRAWYLLNDRRMTPNTHGNICLPKWSALTFRRMFSRKLFTQKFTQIEDGRKFGVNAAHDMQFVRIDLRPDEKIYFRVKNLVAFTDNISLKTELNTKLAAFLQFRTLYPTAHGPGSIILSLEGGYSGILPDARDIGASPFDLVAFDMKGKFRLQSKINMANIYFGGYSIFQDDQSLAIRHSPVEGKRRGLHLIERIKFFLLPF